MIRSTYLRPALTGRSIARISNSIAEQLKPLHRGYSAIAIRGFSGALIGSSVAALLNKDLIIIRKENENSHTRLRLEGRVKDRTKYIIVDDMISTGKTIQEIQIAIESAMQSTKMVGIVLYNPENGISLPYYSKVFKCWIKTKNGKTFK